MSIFRFEQNHFGLDIGSKSLRLVEIRSGPRPVLATYGSLDIPAGLSQSDAKTDMDQLAKYIKDLVARTGTKTKNVSCALSGTNVFTATIKMPYLEPKELSQAISFQVEQHIPLAKADIKYDYNVVRSTSNAAQVGSPSEEMVVMIVASPIAKVNRLVDLIDRAGLNLMVLEASALSFSRALSPQTAGPFVLINIGSLTTELAIVEASNVVLVRTINVGGDAFTRAISQSLGVDAAQAEQFKIKFGLDETKLEGSIIAAVKPMLAEIAEEIRRSVKFYQNEFKGVMPERVIIAGGGSKLFKLPEYLANTLKLPVSFGNAWGKISFPQSESGNLSALSLDFGVAVGLALRE